MRVTASQISAGIAKYVDSELVPKMPGIRKWFLGISGAYVGYMAEQKIMEHEKTLKLLSIMGEDNMIDIDALRSRLISVASTTGPVTEELPVFGKVTFDVPDIEKLYSLIAG